ncbi:primosomal protein N' [Microbispora cellulosiformans]|uniref:Probable replication restart protein PriA n=1 Tax=Microbispora cellulosiformans TaxID=2614688 RepID=A0A5J5K6R7_9ACTN|nr:primosomal protein N' [Microbispora cellulosiformans]KAA9379860.1 primosomal protein N' [Microbispora cellulosiformans]
MTEPTRAPHPQEALLPVPPAAGKRYTRLTERTRGGGERTGGGTERAGARKGAREAAASLPVARIVVDTPLPHLDRPFDYLVPAAMDAEAVPGCRVRVRFAGQLADGYLLERLAESEHEGRLSFLERVVSPEPVLTPEIARLARAVADRYAGTLPDVLRLAIPPRHARVEAEARAPVRRADLPADLPADTGAAAPAEGDEAGRVTTGPASVREEDTAAGTADATPVSAYAGPWEAYPSGVSFLEALAEGRAPRAVWTALPGTDAGGPAWPHAIAAAARATLDGGRGVVVVVPDGKDVALVAEALGDTPHVAITADLGPAERYRRWLKALRGEAGIAVGNRPAAFAPVARLGLAVIWDDGDDLHAERHAPYPHAREVLGLRAHQAGAGLLVGGYTRTAEATALVETGWAGPLVPDRAAVRARAPRVRPAGDDAELARDQAARAARLPSVAWRALREGLEHGPVLVQVPRRGYLPALACRHCRAPARCSGAPPVRLTTEPSHTGPSHTGPPNTGRSYAGQPNTGSSHTGQPYAEPSDGEQSYTGPVCSGPLALRGGHAMPYCRWCGRIAGDWRCPSCGGNGVRAVIVGARRTAEELGRAFPSVAVRTSGRDGVLARVSGAPALVVATPGAEPVPDGGYAAAVLLDGWALLGRPDLRAAEETLRRWANAAALLRPAGELVVMADAAVPAVQALLRWDPVTFAERELDDRAELGFPPAVRMATLTGPAAAVRETLADAGLPPGAQVLGPVPVDGGQERAMVRVPRHLGSALARALKGASGVRSARKAPDVVRVNIDPLDLI